MSRKYISLAYQAGLGGKEADLKRMHEKNKEQPAVSDGADAPLYLTEKPLFLLAAVMFFYNMHVRLRPGNAGIRNFLYHAHEMPVDHAAHALPVYDLRAGDDLAPLVI